MSQIGSLTTASLLHATALESTLHKTSLTECAQTVAYSKACLRRLCGSADAASFSDQVATILLGQLRQQGLDRVLPVPCDQSVWGRRRLAAHALGVEPGKPRALLQVGYTNLSFVLIFENAGAAQRGVQTALNVTTAAAFSVRHRACRSPCSMHLPCNSQLRPCPTCSI